MWCDAKIEQRFWLKVDRGDDDVCWLWTGLTGGSADYGYISVKGKMRRAHRVAWSISNGRDIPSGMCILHSCDNPKCCNPSHLRLGTQLENIREREAKGRGVAARVFGNDRKWCTKLTWDKVCLIRDRAESGETHTAIAASYGMGRSAISRIIRGEAWTKPNGTDHIDRSGVVV